MLKEVKKMKNAVAVYLDGELDQYAAAELKSKIDVEAELSGKKNLIIDLTDVSLMDSSGIGLIIGRYKTLAPLGGFVALSGGNDGVKRVIKLSGIEKIIQTYDTASDADTALGRERRSIKDEKLS